MMAAKAPLGFYTQVEVVLILANHRTLIYHWTTPLALFTALRKAPTWAKQELRAKGIRGRSRIIGLAVEAHYTAGGYKR
jgi:hypothetical protein